MKPWRHDAKEKLITSEAKMLEMNYISHFDSNMHRLPMVVINPLDGQQYRIKEWNARNHRVTSELRKLYLHSGKRIRGSRLEYTYPCNMRSTYFIHKRTLRGNNIIKIIMEAYVHNHLTEYQDRGCDSRPMDLVEITKILFPAIEKAKNEGFFHILGFVSPTGFSDQCMKYFTSKKRHENFLNPYISVCLVDLTNGKVHSNPYDTRMNGFSNLFDPNTAISTMKTAQHFMLDENRNNKTMIWKFIQDTLIQYDSVSLEEICEQLDMDQKAVLVIVKEFEDKRLIKTKDLPDIGLIIQRSY